MTAGAHPPTLLTTGRQCHTGFKWRCWDIRRNACLPLYECIPPTLDRTVY
jgi:hypothetical protein